MVIVLAEKPSAASNLAKALGGRHGSYGGVTYEVFSLLGHLMRLKAPEEQVAPPLREKYSSWDPASLPWDPAEFAWEREFRDASRRKVATDLRKRLADADEVAIATDDDPSGEGELIAWEALLWCGWNGTTTRMHFVDEAEASLREAFANRVPLRGAGSDGEYLKAVARDRWDLLSMQLTRAASAVARDRGMRLTLRQGRLKSVMVRLVGDQERAHAEYKRVPFYEPRYRDSRGNVLAPASEDLGYRKATPSEVDLAPFGVSRVVVDSTERRRTQPPRLLDLAALSAMLATAGHGAAEVLACYQRMYENQVVSYPRTEDKTVTEEQFAELLPIIDEIARVVDVDAAILTHRSPRPTHVRAEGTHGANRPGTNVPRSLVSLNEEYGPCAADIYRCVARSYLSMLAEDYEYDLSKAHIEDHPDFVGETKVPAAQGWRAVFDADAELRDEANTRTWGTTAKPFMHEGANRRPQAPTQKWLMRALERYEVGTGASRTSTFAECSSGAPGALMTETRGKLALTECGKASWTLLQGCDIASPEVTEALLAQMALVGSGEVDIEDVTATVAPLVIHDLERMRENASGIEAPTGPVAPCPRCGMPMARSRSGKVWFCTSRKGHRSPDGTWVVDDAGCGFTLLPKVCGRVMTDAQVLSVLSGSPVSMRGLVSSAGKVFDAVVELDADSKYGTRLVFGRGPKGGHRAKVRRGPRT